ncbi:hypothetical protein tb265_05180 [Gemmatimonadetes bacterium T265]|nr:hypothetical protein tb265_05180 [Gemmatimonadetes bacterium T265]
MDRDDRRSGERDAPVRGSAERSGGRAPPSARQAAGRAARSGGFAYAGVGFQFAASLVVFFYLGQWLDRRFGTAPVFLLVCVLVGSGAALYAMYRQLMAAQRRDATTRDTARDTRP